MQGNILDYSIQTNSGIIVTEDGTRFKFTGADWKESSHPARGTSVDFSTEEDRALDVYFALKSSGAIAKPGSRATLNNTQQAEKSKVVAGVFALLLGSFGAHKFYLGYKGVGFAFLGIWLGGLILLGIPSLVIWIISLVEGIIYLCKTDQEFQETYVDSTKTWF